MSTLNEDLLAAGIDPQTIPPWSNATGAHTGPQTIERILRNHLTGHHPTAWRGYDVRVEGIGLLEREPRVLCLRSGPWRGFPELSGLEYDAGVETDEWRNVIGPVWCDFGPTCPSTIGKPNVREGDALWVHLPWGNIPCWRFDQVARLLWGAMLLEGIAVARFIAQHPERPIWPYHQTDVIPTGMPEGQQAAADLEAYFDQY